MAVKIKEPTSGIQQQLADSSLERLKMNLSSDTTKKAFWINVYNAYFLILRLQKQVERPAIFRDKLITIAGIQFSLDDIEHGILRKYRWKWSLGYLPHIFAPAILRQLAVDKMDPRIHFALNCGAKSCPPIAFYTPEKINQQLEVATQAFLENETKVFPEKREIHASRLLLWYQGDFGGKKGALRFLNRYLNQNFGGWKLRYQPYNWEEALGNFAEGSEY